MSLQMIHPISPEYVTLEQYANIERQTGIKHEYHDGVVRAMAEPPRRILHSAKTSTITVGATLRSIRCLAVPSAASARFSYPKRIDTSTRI